MTSILSITRVLLLRNSIATVFHEQILAPLRSRLGGVAHRSSLHPISQRRGICQQRHPCFFGRAVALALVASEASGAQVLSHSSPAARTRHDVVDRQVERPACHSTILA